MQSILFELMKNYLGDTFLRGWGNRYYEMEIIPINKASKKIFKSQSYELKVFFTDFRRYEFC